MACSMVGTGRSKWLARRRAEQSESERSRSLEARGRDHCAPVHGLRDWGYRARGRASSRGFYGAARPNGRLWSSCSARSVDRPRVRSLGRRGPFRGSRFLLLHHQQWLAAIFFSFLGIAYTLRILFFFPFSFRNGGEGRFPNRAHRGCRLDILYITRC
jgi:hypothetical protein